MRGHFRWSSPGFVLLMRHREEAGLPQRLGITVTKKIGNAVIRNRLKRRLRALARGIIPQHGPQGCDFVLIGREDGVLRDFAQMQTDLARGLGKCAKP